MNKFLFLLVAVALSACTQVDKFSDRELKPRTAQEPVAPLVDGMITTQAGDTVYTISRRYNVPISAIVRENNLARPYALQGGERLRIPAGGNFTAPQDDSSFIDTPTPALTANEPISISQSAAASRVETATLAPLDIKPSADNNITTESGAVDNSWHPSDLEKGKVRYQLTPLGPSTTPPPAAAPQAQAQPQGVSTGTPDAATIGTLDWPVDGRVTKIFGKLPSGESSDGLNIAAPRGTPVAAAAGGVVIHAGGGVGALGNLVLIRHAADGLITAYGHLDRVLVDKDSIVATGDVIGTVGTSGGVKKPQLHFQVRKGETPVDPMAYLTKR